MMDKAEFKRLLSESTPEERGRVACWASDLSAEQRVALANKSSADWRGRVACCAPDLSAEQREGLQTEMIEKGQRSL